MTELTVGMTGTLELYGKHFPARIVATDVKGCDPILCLYTHKPNSEVPCWLSANGTDSSDVRFIPAPKIVSRWDLVAMHDGFGGREDTEEFNSDHYGGQRCVVRYDYDEATGELLTVEKVS